MRRFVVEVSPSAFERLAALAWQQRRPVRDEAGWLLERLLTQLPLDPPDETGDGHGSRASPTTSAALTEHRVGQEGRGGF